MTVQPACQLLLHFFNLNLQASEEFGPSLFGFETHIYTRSLQLLLPHLPPSLPVRFLRAARPRHAVNKRINTSAWSAHSSYVL